MADPGAFLPLVDLVGCGAYEMVVVIDLTGRRLSQVAAVLKAPNREALTEILLLDQYEASKVEHEVGAYFVQADDGRISGLRVVFDQEPIGTGKEPSFAAFLQALTPLNWEVKARCTLTLSYDTESWTSVVKLPWVLLSSDVAPFDEIRGVQLSKRTTEGQRSWDVVVNLDEGKLNHMVFYSVVGRLNQSLFIETLTAGTAISTSLVRPNLPREGVR